MAVYIEGKDEEEEKKGILPKLMQKERLNLLELIPKQHFTQPPPRYTEATLVKTLEEKGIGRPSTYATIISTIQERAYVKLKEKKFYPTELGKLVNELLIKSFPDILDVGFTAQLESKLDKIEDGELNWINVLNDFYIPFKDSLIKAEEAMTDIKKQQEKITSILCEKCNKPMVVKTSKYGNKFLACSTYPKCWNIKSIELKEDGSIQIKEDEKTDILCDICGKAMVIKQGQYGKFLACSGYPRCKNIKSVETPQQSNITTDEKCDKCGANLVLREGRYGKFLSCSNYPKCKFSKSVSSEVLCPTGCGGQLIRKRSKKGFFYGCTNYPKCEFATWGELVQEECPECGYMVVKRKSKSGMQILACCRKGCNYEEVIGG
jgi:DNA topoisomerase-1